MSTLIRTDVPINRLQIKCYFIIADGANKKLLRLEKDQCLSSFSELIFRKKHLSDKEAGPHQKVFSGRGIKGAAGENFDVF